MNKLYMINIGGSTTYSNIEVHDILFVVASTIKETYDLVREAWYGSKESLHIDSYKELISIDGYELDITNTKVNADKTGKLFMIIYGGHKPGEFSESHRIHFIVANTKNQAESKANQELARFKPMDHVDSVCDVQKVLLGEKGMITFKETNVAFDEVPDWNGYIKLYK